MFTKKQLEPPTDAQLSYINSLERKTGLIFYGNTKRDAIKFIEKAKRIIEDSKMIKRKVDREDEKFPYVRIYEYIDIKTRKEIKQGED